MNPWEANEATQGMPDIFVFPLDRSEVIVLLEFGPWARAFLLLTHLSKVSKASYEMDMSLLSLSSNKCPFKFLVIYGKILSPYWIMGLIFGQRLETF